VMDPFATTLIDRDFECNGLISTASLARLTRLKTLWFHLEVGETNFNHPEYDFSVLIT
jgi:hypothetical protein